MKELLMKYKVNMIFVVIVSIAAGMAGTYFLNNRWLGFIFVCLPLCALYCYQSYQEQKDYRDAHVKNKHKNKYR